ncbi:O-antigen ligase family protein [Flavobacterium cauense]|nr:O-antigen ligase family protein [Flavobacterium cauense]
MIAQLIGISIISIYYYNFIPLYDKNDIIAVYVKLSLYAAIIGYVFYFLNINLNDGRLQSIFKEPAHYVIVVIPACFYFLKQKNYIAFATIFGTLILSNSSLGYIGCALMFIIPNLNLKRLAYFAASVPVILATFYYVYTEYPFFQLRVNDTYESLNSVNTGKFNEYTNLSSYALLSNIFVAKENIKDHPFGSGIGSHVYMHRSVYSKEMRPPEYLIKQNLEKINSNDANSLFTRMMSELGILGFIAVILFLIKTLPVFNDKRFILSQGIFIYFLLKLFRDGHYFPPELFFFVWFFYFDFFRAEKNAASE